MPHADYNQDVALRCLTSRKPFNDAMLETMEILADRHLMAQIEDSKKDIEQGRLIDLDEAF